MKILVVQLARFGDIYQTWPILRALKRKFPHADVEILVRERFASALEGIGLNCRVHTLNTVHILEPIFMNGSHFQESYRRLLHWTADLKDGEFDEIINLSFSPSSSYLVDVIKGPSTRIKGYTRTEDGFLAIPDDSSAYFYAQVGVGKANRAHITEIFAAVAGVDLDEGDWLLADFQRSPEAQSQLFQRWNISIQGDYAIVHVSASNSRKTLNWEQWSQVVEELLENWSGELVLVGGGEDRLVADRIMAHCQSTRVHSIVAKARLSEVMTCVCGARLVIGGDSVLMQMASLAQVEAFNLSFPIVNFWETGPLEPGSRIFVVEGSQSVNLSCIAQEILRQLNGQSALSQVAIATGDSPVHYAWDTPHSHKDFQWDLICALYMDGDYPPATTALVRHGFCRLYELADLAISHILTLQNENVGAVAAEILAQVDLLIAAIRRMVPDLDPVISWFETQKLRIGPGAIEEVALQTRQVFESLKIVASLYTHLREAAGIEQGASNANDNLVS